MVLGIFKYRNNFVEKKDLLAQIYKDAEEIQEKYRDDFINEAKRQYSLEFDPEKKEVMNRLDKFSRISIYTGIALLVLVILLTLFVPSPTPFQIFVFRVILATAAAAFGSTIPGFLNLELPLWGTGVLRAGGALTLFVIIYMLNPPELIIAAQ